MNNDLEQLYTKLIDTTTALVLIDEAIDEAKANGDKQKVRALLVTKDELQEQAVLIQAQIKEKGN